MTIGRPRDRDKSWLALRYCKQEDFAVVDSRKSCKRFTASLLHDCCAAGCVMPLGILRLITDLRCLLCCWRHVLVPEHDLTWLLRARSDV